jgi:hypothetical protein
MNDVTVNDYVEDGQEMKNRAFVHSVYLLGVGFSATRFLKQ